MSTFYPDQIFEQVNSMLDERKLMQTIDYRFEKYQESAKAGKGFCPIHREGLFRNLVIDREAHTFKCQYSQCPGSAGGTLVKLFAMAQGLDDDTALRQIVRDQNLAVDLPVNEAMVKAGLAEADSLFESQPEAAESRYLELLEAAPSSAEAHLGLMKIYEARGDTALRNEKLATVCRLKIAAGKAAEIPELIREWSELEPDSPEARFACAELVNAEGDAESAVMEFMGAGDACEVSGDLESALRAYRRAAALSAEHHVDVIDVNPHVIRVLTELGRAGEAVTQLISTGDKALESDDAAGAVEQYLMALDVEPQSDEAHQKFIHGAMRMAPTPVIAHQVIVSSQFFREKGDYDLAIQALEDYATIAPENEDVLHALINEYNNNGKAQDAINLEARLALLVYGLGRVEEAQEISERVLTWQPQNVPMLEAVAHFQELEGQDDEARETKRRIVRALLGQRKYPDALEAAERLLTEAEGDEGLLDLKASALEGLGRAGDPAARDGAASVLESLADKHLEATTSRRAIMYLMRAVDLMESPGTELLFKLARAHMRNKAYPQVRDTVIMACESLAGRDRLDEAILEAERYSNLIPEDTDLVRYLVELYLRFDDKPAAVSRMRRLAEDLKSLGRDGEAEEVNEQANEMEPQNLENLSRQLGQYNESGNFERIGQTQLKLAAFHEQEGNYAEASKSLESYLASNPDDRMAINRLITAYDKLGTSDEARQWRLSLARLLRTANDHDREARTLRDVLQKFPDDEEALQMLMNADFNRGDMQSGVISARRLTTIQMAGGKTEIARKTLMKAVERLPENLDLNRDIYELHRQSNQPNQALTWGRKVISILRTGSKNAEVAVIFDQLVELDPANLSLKQEQLKFLEETGRNAELADKRLGLAELYRSQERYKDAEGMLKSVLKMDERNLDARQQLADLYGQMGETARAERQHVRVAGILHVQGDSARARDILRQVLAENPSSIDARRQLSHVYRLEGNVPSAISELLELSDSYRRQGQEAEALACEREAIELDPSNVNVRRRMIESLMAAGKNSLAADELEQLAKSHQENKDLDQAMTVIDEIIAMEPTRLATRKLKAELLMAQGKSTEAMAELQQLADLAVSGSATSTSGPTGPNDTDGFSRRALQIVKEYTFDSYVVGSNNDFAYATALAIAKSPARAYNPLFLYANVGLGKTHLCNAIANYMLEREPGSRIIYTNSEDFTDELVESIQNNAVQEFRTRYRSLDLLIVDDVQFLAGKERAQEEFFHIFNNLFQAKRQIVITSDRPPAEIAHLENRLRSRFGAGVIVDIATPDLETRLAILNREVEDAKLNVDGWVPRLLSEKVDTNVRDLKGALNQVIAMRDLRKQTITEETVSKMVEALYPQANV